MTEYKHTGTASSSSQSTIHFLIFNFSLFFMLLFMCFFVCLFCTPLTWKMFTLTKNSFKSTMLYANTAQREYCGKYGILQFHLNAFPSSLCKRKNEKSCFKAILQLSSSRLAMLIYKSNDTGAIECCKQSSNVNKI